jgi:hypothetical protein
VRWDRWGGEGCSLSAARTFLGAMASTSEGTRHAARGSRAARVWTSARAGSTEVNATPRASIHWQRTSEMNSEGGNLSYLTARRACVRTHSGPFNDPPRSLYWLCEQSFQPS